MGVLGYWFTLVVLVLMDNSLANPLLEGVATGRTFFQQNMRCGTRSAFQRISMSNPTPIQNCEYIIRAFSTRVCQVRIEFTQFELDQPRTTNSRQYAFCADDHMTIDGMPFDLCGRISSHVYVPFDVRRITDEMKINFRVSSNSFARWNINVRQIECGHKAALVTPDVQQAPDGCLQYFYEPSGRFESFNFGSGSYYGNTHYAICFDRNYNPNAVLELTNTMFQMDGIGGEFFDNDCLTSDPAHSKDYIAIPFAEGVGEGPHSLFCGNSLHRETVSFNGAGPMVIHVNTDDKLTENQETGFSFAYRISTSRSRS